MHKVNSYWFQVCLGGPVSLLKSAISSKWTESSIEQSYDFSSWKAKTQPISTNACQMSMESLLLYIQLLHHGFRNSKGGGKTWMMSLVQDAQFHNPLQKMLTKFTSWCLKTEKFQLSVLYRKQACQPVRLIPFSINICQCLKYVRDGYPKCWPLTWRQPEWTQVQSC